MSTRPNALGRGIGALLPGAPPAAGLDVSATVSHDAPGEIPVDAIDPNPEQPRRAFDAIELERLADSIRQHGVLQPIVLRRVGSRYELVVGERRWRATRAAGLAKIPAIIADVDERERLELALVENVQRRDLNPIELAHAFRSLSEGGTTQEEIGRRVGLDRSTVANHLRLLELPRELQADVESACIGIGHAKALLQLSNPERRRHLRDRIVNEGLSVRAAEQLARATGRPRQSQTPRGRAAVDPNLQRVVDLLRQRLQTRIRIQGGADRGRIEIEYFGEEDLQRLTAILLGDA
ncbi:MAG: ParB/RepB/Spo0J family partition protein [Deltaproteobacteria bacterium]|nr:ParB/RepB/Spo0J family partition protein [Deltaproteobacteria bacterium]